MEDQSTKPTGQDNQTDAEGQLSVDEFARLIARYRSVGYEAYYDWKLTQYYHQMPRPVEVVDLYAGILSNN